jgi:hypothetical protein
LKTFGLTTRKLFLSRTWPCPWIFSLSLSCTCCAMWCWCCVLFFLLLNNLHFRPQLNSSSSLVKHLFFLFFSIHFIFDEFEFFFTILVVYHKIFVSCRREIKSDKTFSRYKTHKAISQQRKESLVKSWRSKKWLFSMCETEERILKSLLLLWLICYNIYKTFTLLISSFSHILHFFQSQHLWNLRSAKQSETFVLFMRSYLE